MIDFRSVTKDYGSTSALNDFSMTIPQHGIYCLLGRNGAGKTTLLKTVAGHIAPTSGAVVVNRQNVKLFDMPDDVHYVESGAAQFNIRLEDLLQAAADINPLFDMSFAQELAKRFALDEKKAL